MSKSPLTEEFMFDFFIEKIGGYFLETHTMLHLLIKSKKQKTPLSGVLLLHQMID